MPSGIFRSPVTGKDDAMTQDFASKQGGMSAWTNKERLMLAAAALFWACLSATAQAEPSAHAGSASAAASAPADELRHRFETLPASELKQVYVQCSRRALERRLDGGEACFCSTAYDVLLKAHFGGDFAALLGWSRQQGDDQTAASAARATSRPTQHHAPRRIVWH
jgi:hypothetical protein